MQTIAALILQKAADSFRYLHHRKYDCGGFRQHDGVVHSILVRLKLPGGGKHKSMRRHWRQEVEELISAWEACNSELLEQLETHVRTQGPTYFYP